MTSSVLVIDDDPAFRRLVKRLLAGSGLNVVDEADSVAAGRMAVTRRQHSAILVDIELPDGDGVALTRELAMLPWNPRIVLTSINEDLVTPEEAQNAGARTFVRKADLPNVNLEQLLGGE